MIGERGNMPEPSRADLVSFGRFAEAFSEADFSPGVWHPADEIEPGLLAVGWWQPSKIVAEWEHAIYDRHVIDPDADYLSEEFGARVREYQREPTRLDDAELDELRAVLTYVVRGERFCDGHIESMFVSGVAQHATRRLAFLGRTSGGN